MLSHFEVKKLINFSFGHFCIGKNIVELEYQDDVVVPWEH